MTRSPESGLTLRSLFRGSASRHDGVEHGLFAVRDEEAWLARWRDYTFGRRPAPAMPHVDLTEETVIVLALGLRVHAGYGVTIGSVEPQHETLVVTATESRPSGDVTFDMACAPVHAVAVRLGRRTFGTMRLDLHIVTEA